MRNTLLFFILTIAISSCQTNHQGKLFVARDFVPDSTFTSGVEGPAVDKEGIVYAVNIHQQGTIGLILPCGTILKVIDLPEGSIGNGIRFDKECRNMFIADYKKHNILRIDLATNKLSVFAHDSSMNQPNDIAIADNGTLFASDPNWADSTGKLWKITPAGETVLLEDAMGTTNGIEVAPDNKKLYVNESIQRKIWVYDLDKNMNISNKRLFFQFSDFGMDGMRCDTLGNLYVTRHGKGTVVVLSPQAKQLREITLKGKKVSNIAFGGKDGKTCYVTIADRGNIETFRVDVPGRSWKMYFK
ncbi:MAG: SMP-30/gluconolactonase/LRE family protein [Bacteroidales bacterium]|nr:SMP-30/gluconolactonase/LRE family protein [Bacteroidales bacterium]